MKRRALLLANSNSRGGSAAISRAVDCLSGHGIELIHRECARREELSPMVVEHRKEIDRVVVVGGDGTLNAAAQGVLQARLPLGVIPAGTGNDLARTLGIPSGIDEAARIIAAGKTRTIDLGCVNDHPFFNVASLGLSEELARELSSDLKRRFGKLGYALAAIKVLARARPFHADIVHDGGVVHGLTLQVAVGNGRFYGGGNIVDKGAEIDDGYLDLYSLGFIRAWRLVLMLRSFRAGEHSAWEEVRTLRGKEFRVRTRWPRQVNADGELITKTPATFRVLRRAIEVFVPQG